MESEKRDDEVSELDPESEPQPYLLSQPSKTPSLVLYESSSGTSTSSDNDTDSEDEENTENSQKSLAKSYTQELGYFICPNENDPIHIKKAFIEKHPIQVTEGKGAKLSFEPSKLYYRFLPNGDQILRKWLSYSIHLNKVFCSSCMAFGAKERRKSTFITGHDVNPKHIYKAVETHEQSRYHDYAAKAAFRSQQGCDVSSLIDSNQTKKREREVHTRRLVVQRLIDIFLFVGKQGIAYRGKTGEGAHSLDSLENHGNFLELVMLIANSCQKVY